MTKTVPFVIKLHPSCKLERHISSSIPICTLLADTSASCSHRRQYECLLFDDSPNVLSWKDRPNSHRDDNQPPTRSSKPTASYPRSCRQLVVSCWNYRCHSFGLRARRYRSLWWEMVDLWVPLYGDVCFGALGDGNDGNLENATQHLPTCPMDVSSHWKFMGDLLGI